MASRVSKKQQGNGGSSHAAAPVNEIAMTKDLQKELHRLRKELEIQKNAVDEEGKAKEVVKKPDGRTEELEREVEKLRQELEGQKELVERANRKTRAAELKVKQIEDEVRSPLAYLVKCYLGSLPAGANLQSLFTDPVDVAYDHPLIAKSIAIYTELISLPEVCSARSAALKNLTAKDMHPIQKVIGIWMAAIGLCLALSLRVAMLVLPTWVSKGPQKELQKTTTETKQ